MRYSMKEKRILLSLNTPLIPHSTFCSLKFSFPLSFFQHIINSVQQFPCSPLSYQYNHSSFKSWFFHLILIHPPKPLQCNSGHLLLYSIHFHLVSFDEDSWLAATFLIWYFLQQVTFTSSGAGGSQSTRDQHKGENFF